MFPTLRRRFLVSFMNTRAYSWFILKVVPKVRFSTRLTKIQGWQFLQLYAMMEPSDILLTLDRHNLAGKMVGALTQGEVAHAAQCIAKGAAWEVSEMTQNGYTQSALYDICKHADRVILATCSAWDDAYKKAIVAKNLSFLGAQYDTRFTLDVEYLACSELIYHADFEHRLQVDLTDEAGIGQPYISPEGLLQAKNLVIKLDTDSMLAPHLVLEAA